MKHTTTWATTGQVPHGDRIACFMPAKRFSTALLNTLRQWYTRGLGGYAELSNPTINAMTNGTFATASEVRGTRHNGFPRLRPCALSRMFRPRNDTAPV